MFNLNLTQNHIYVINDNDVHNMHCCSDSNSGIKPPDPPAPNFGPLLLIIIILVIVCLTQTTGIISSTDLVNMLLSIVVEKLLSPFL